ncbi:hypothetical protein ACSSVY_003613 [Roseovarius sp. MBR-51]
MLIRCALVTAPLLGDGPQERFLSINAAGVHNEFN